MNQYLWQYRNRRFALTEGCELVRRVKARKWFRSDDVTYYVGMFDAVRVRRIESEWWMEHYRYRGWVAVCGLAGTAGVFWAIAALAIFTGDDSPIDSIEDAIYVVVSMIMTAVLTAVWWHFWSREEKLLGNIVRRYVPGGGTMH